MVNPQDLVTRIQSLSPARQSEVADFVAFLAERDRDRELSASALAASNPAFSAVWDNDDDEIYDRL